MAINPLVPENTVNRVGKGSAEIRLECLKLLEIILTGGGTDAIKAWVDEGDLTEWEGNFIHDMRSKAAGLGIMWRPSSNQLFRLREVKDKLVEGGLI